MISLTIRRTPERIFWAALLFCTVYQSYRYPLKYSSSGTSPTYSDTPLAFQLVKFLVAIALCMLSAVYIPRRSLAFRKWAFATLILCLSLYPIVKALGGDAEDKVSYLNVAFWPLACLILVLAVDRVSVKAVDRFFRFVLIYALLSDLVQIVLFFTIGRLPALAHAGSLSIRFGGFIDDPNGFAALLYMLAGWAYYRFTGRRFFVTMTALLFCILFTQSFTAVGFLALIASLLVARALLRPRKLLLTVCLGAVVAVALVAVWSPLSQVIGTLAQGRSNSVDQHLSQLTSVTLASPLWWLFGDTTYSQFESWWGSSLINFGTPWYLLSLGLVATLFVSVFRRFQRAQNPRDKAVLSGLLLLSAYFVFGNANLPLFTIFPINFLFFFFSFLVYFEKLSLELQTPNGAVQAAPEIS